MGLKIDPRVSATPAAGRRARRAEARRLEILRAASRTFRTRGFAASGMREIAADADLSPGNLYHYFHGKNEILYFCQDRSLDLMMRALSEARASREPASEKIRRVLAAHIRCLLDDLEGSAAHLEVESLPGNLRGKIVAKRDRYERGIRALVAAGQRRGEFAPSDPGLVTRAMLGAANWTARWFRPDGPQRAGEVAEQLAAYLVAGLVAHGAERSGGRGRRNGAGESSRRAGAQADPRSAGAGEGSRRAGAEGARRSAGPVRSSVRGISR